ncbi:unnamed protein product [Closterium sp. NIES-53]
MASQRLVSVLPRVLSSLPPSPAPSCTHCVEGRLRATPHSSSLRPATVPFQTLHLDVWGPAPRPGPQRESFILVVVDDYFRYTTVFPLAKKSNVTSTLIRWLLATKTTRSRRVSCLHSNLGGEFRSGILAGFCREQGITHLWTGSPGVASEFRVWGCLALVRDTSVDKLSARTIPCVFLGFPVDSSDYICYNLPLHRFFDSRDVQFEESVSYYTEYPCRGLPVPPLPLFLAPSPPPAPAPSIHPAPPGPAPSGVSHATPLHSVACHVPSPSPQSSSQSPRQPSALQRQAAVDSGGVVVGGTGTGGASSGPGAGGAGSIGFGAEGVGAGGASSEGAGAEGTGAGGVSFGGTRAGSASTRNVSSGGARAGDTSSGGAGAGSSTGAQGAGAVIAGAAGAGAAAVGALAVGGAAVPAAAATAAAAAVATATATAFATVASTCEWPSGPWSSCPSSRPITISSYLRPHHSPPQSVLPSPPVSSLTASTASPITDYYRATRPVLTRVLASLVTDPRASPSSILAITATVADFAATRRLDYATRVVPARPLSVGGECAFGCDVLEDRQFELEFLASASPHLCAMLLAPEGDPDALDIPTPRTYREEVSG